MNENFQMEKLDLEKAEIISHSEGCLFTLLIVSFDVQKLLRLIRSYLAKLIQLCKV